MRESEYQRRLIKKLKQLFPGCFVLKNDSSYIQGIPDLLILYRDQWAALELKAGPRSRRRPNQVYYVEVMDEMSFAAFICAENEEEVLHDLQLAFESGRTARVLEP